MPNTHSTLATGFAQGTGNFSTISETRNRMPENGRKIAAAARAPVSTLPSIPHVKTSFKMALQPLSAKSSLRKSWVGEGGVKAWPNTTDVQQVTNQPATIMTASQPSHITGWACLSLSCSRLAIEKQPPA